jgi:Secretion system C-terminal sorting domain
MLLKKILYILFFVLFVSLSSQGQSYSQPDNSTTQVKFLKTYPNPAITIVNIEFQKGYNRSYSLQILNSLVRKVYMAQSIPTAFSIDLRKEKIYRGIYIYQLLDRKGSIIESGKILVVD